MARVSAFEVSQEPDREPESPSLLRLLTLLVRRRRLLIGLPLLAAAAALAVSFLMPQRFTVEARFTPESDQPDASRLAGLASQLGVSLGGMEAGTPLDFYAELLESRELLRAAALTDYTFASRSGADTLSGSLVALLDAKGDTQAERIHEAIEMLDELITVRVDQTAEIVLVETSAPWPALAVLLSRRLLDLVNEFNLERRQSRATAERSFLESRVDEVGSELRQVENQLEEFLSQNRRWQDSPQLVFEENRLQRRVGLSQQLFMSLTQELEQARLAEVRNTPVITVIDQPRPPAERTAPNYILNALLGLFVGGLIALAAIIGSDLMGHARRSHPDEFAELEAATREALGRFGR